jgi:predicted metalloprotease
VLAVGLLLAACGGPKPQVPEMTRSGPPVNKLVIQAIADLEKYWGKEMPELYQNDFEPITGGYYAVIPSADDAPPCASAASEVARNAFYCSTEDVVAWDAEELLPTLQKKYGDFVIPVVMAHEWGHAVQARSNFTARTVTKELRADCFAGAWSKHAKDDGVFEVRRRAVRLDRQRRPLRHRGLLHSGLSRVGRWPEAAAAAQHRAVPP